MNYSDQVKVEGGRGELLEINCDHKIVNLDQKPNYLELQEPLVELHDKTVELTAHR